MDYATLEVTLPIRGGKAPAADMQLFSRRITQSSNWFLRNDPIRAS